MGTTIYVGLDVHVNSIAVVWGRVNEVHFRSAGVGPCIDNRRFLRVFLALIGHLLCRLLTAKSDR